LKKGGFFVFIIVLFLMEIIDMNYSIEDEFSTFKSELLKLGIKVISINKVGNGSMSFHEVFYTSPKYDEVKSIYIQRQDLDLWIEKFKKAYLG